MVAVGAFYKDRIEGFYGAPQSVASHHFAQRAGGAGFFIEAAPVHPMLSAIAMPGFGPSLRDNMKLLGYVCATISLMVDGFDASENGGTVTLRDGGGPKLDYPFTDRMAECFREGMKAMARIHLANGAREVVKRLAPAATRRIGRRLASDEAVRRQARVYVRRYQTLVDDAVVRDPEGFLMATLLGDEAGRLFLLLDAAAGDQA